MKMLMHFMQGIVGSTLSESQFAGAELWSQKWCLEFVGRWEVEGYVLWFVGCNAFRFSMHFPLPRDAGFRHVAFLNLNPVCYVMVQAV